MMPEEVTVGLKFPYHIADGVCMFTVTGHIGEDVWRCVCDADQDYAGSVANVDESVILDILRREAAFKESDAGHESWFGTLSPGDIVHVDQGFGQFVRCRVEEGEYEEGLSGRRVSGKHVVAIALVGDWLASDLPQRTVYGTVRYPHHADLVVHGGHYRPSLSNIWESPHHYKEGQDPRGLDPISLKLPEMTPEEVRWAAMAIVRAKVIEVLMSKELPDPADFRTAIHLLGMYAH